MGIGDFLLGTLGGDDSGDNQYELNYEVGNSSGFDVGGSPSPMGERIGHQAQRGGSVQEIVVDNPGTFQIEKDEIIDTVNSLEIDISVHTDATVGFTSAYKTRSQAVGYEISHNYFTRYLTQFAVFKNEVETREDVSFNVQRINPHISTSSMPALNERMAQDVGLDPFGYELPDLDSRGEEKNIYRNPEFMKRFYHTFILHEIDDPYQIYQVFDRFSPRFRQEWREAQKDALDDFWGNVDVLSSEHDTVTGKIALVRAAMRKDQGIETAWYQILNDEVGFEEPLEVDMSGGNSEEWEDLNDVPGLSELRGASKALIQIRNNELSRSQLGMGNISYDLTDSQIEAVEEKLEDALDLLWEGNGEEFRISVEAKRDALNNRLDIQPTQVLEDAQDDEELEEAAEELMGMDLDYFEEESEMRKAPEKKYWEMIESLISNFEREMWKESKIFYFIMPAWMSVAGFPDEDSNSWEAPEFIWEALVERKWSDDYDLDLKDPGKEDGYFDALEKEQEFRMDVAASVAALYVWGHFTQVETRFQVDREEYMDDVDERMTWVEWMNRFGIGVNLEAFIQQGNEYYKSWRPKDVAVAAHAVNREARKQLGSIHKDLDGRLAKFTLDLEHTASFGVDPMKELELLIDQEKELAESGLTESDPEKPLSKIMREWHLVKEGLETKQGESLHGPWMRGDTQLYGRLYRMVEAGFARNEDEPAYIMYEVGGEQAETVYMARIAMNLAELGVTPEDLDPSRVPQDGNYENEEQALIARFFGMDQATVNQEWAKIEEHAFDPLEGLLEAEEFDYTWSGRAATDNQNRPDEWQNEEYR